MAGDNPFFALQQRLAALLEAHAYFTGLTATQQILTEEVGDLQFKVNEIPVKLGFGVVIATAAGKPLVSSYEALVTMEDLNVSIMHNPTTMPDRKLLDALLAAVEAIQGKTVQSEEPPAPRPHDYFTIVGHQRRFDGPPGTHVHELHVQGGLRLR